MNKHKNNAYRIVVGGEMAIVNLLQEMEERLQKNIDDLKQQVIDEIEVIRMENLYLPAKAAKEVVIPVQDKIIEKTEVVKEQSIFVENDFDAGTIWEKIEKLEEEIKKPRGFLGTIGGRAGFQVLSSGSKVGTKTNELNFVGATVTNSYGRITVTTTGGSSSILTPTGTVNGSNTSFVFTSTPIVIYRDGVAMQKTSSDGTVNWTGTTSVTLSVAPTFDIYGL